MNGDEGWREVERMEMEDRWREDGDKKCHYDIKSVSNISQPRPATLV